MGAALSQTDGPDAGYATAAASSVCLALAVTVTAFMTYAASEARAAKRGLRQVQTEALLQGGHVLAVVAVLDNATAGRLRWTDSDGSTAFEILAEPERDKLDAKSAATDMVRQLGAADPVKVSSIIQSGISTRNPVALPEVDSSEAWRRCANSVLSYYGEAKKIALSPANAADQTGLKPHVGEVWRIRVSTNGWADDRVVRLTGNGQRPTNLISRSFYRSSVKGEPCATLFTTP